jgi:HK97 family phage prohead protease
MEKHTRFHAGELHIRSAGGRRTIVGYASVFGSPTTLRDDGRVVQRETIAPGAFAHALKTRQDVRCLFNHDPSQLLGRTEAGTLRLREDDKGLWIECEPPDTELGRSVLAMIQRGDVTGQSFAFLPRPGGETRETRQEGGRTIVEAVVTSVHLFDVGPVTYPAYNATSVLVRGGLVAPDALDRAAADERRRRLRALESFGFGMARAGGRR